MPERIDTRVRKLLELREKNDRAQKAAKQAKRALDEHQARLYAELKDEGITTTTVDTGAKYGKVRIQTRQTRKARVVDLEAALASLAERGLAEEFFKDDVRQKQLNQYVRTLQEQGEPLPAGVEPVTTEYISVTKKS